MSQRFDGQVTRRAMDGHTWRWERGASRWPGRRGFVALEGGEVTLGDDYGAHRQRYTCQGRELLEGAFHDAIRADFGQGVLDEVLAELRRLTPTRAADPIKPRVRRKEPEAGGAVASTPQASGASGGGASTGAPAASAPAGTGGRTLSVTPPAAGRLAVVWTGAGRLDMALVTALAAASGRSHGELVAAAGALPLVISDRPADEARSLGARLETLGAQVALVGG